MHRALPIALLLASSLALGCVEELPKDSASKGPKGDGLQAAVQAEEPDTGPAPNAPAAIKDILDPLVEDAPTGKYGGTIALYAYEDPKTFNPTLITDSTSGRFIAYTFDGLVEEDGITFEVLPALAKSWTLGADGKTYTFKLRRGVTWHDGKPFTADDVVFTWMTVLPNQDIPWESRDSLKVDGKLPIVTKLDDETVQFQLSKPFAPFMRSMGIPILPKHVFGPWVSAKGKDGKPLSNSQWGVDCDVTKLIGTGPFMFESYAPGERMVFKRNPHYYRVNRHNQPLPYVDRMTIPFLKTLDTAILKFKAGETDTQWLPGKDVTYMKPLEKEGNFTILNGGPDFRTSYIAFNLNQGLNKEGKPYLDPVKRRWFAEKRFRQAVSHAINRKAIIKAVFRGLAVPQDSPIFQRSPYFDPTVPKYDYDLVKAEKLLNEAGFKKANGVLRDAEGHPVKFALMHQVGSKEGDMEVNMIKADLKRLGMDVTAQGVTFNVSIARTNESKDWDCTLGAWGAGVEPHGVVHLWKSNGQSHFFNLNPSEHAAPTYPWEKRIDEIFEAGSLEVDEKKRKALYNEFQQIVGEEQPLIFLPVFYYTAAIRNTVGNVRPSAYSVLGSSWNCYELYKK